LLDDDLRECDVNNLVATNPDFATFTATETNALIDPAVDLDSDGNNDE